MFMGSTSNGIKDWEPPSGNLTVLLLEMVIYFVDLPIKMADVP